MADTVIRVYTSFDCTPTLTRGSYRPSSGQLDRLGNSIVTEEQWLKSRNKQRNWETFQQIFSLRCQMFDIVEPETGYGDGQLFWRFQFRVEVDQVFYKDGDPVGLLKEDCHAVPMIIGLDETNKELFLTPYIVTKGAAPNTVFEVFES